MIKGYCDPKFQNVYDAFANSIKSEFETGAALAIEHQGNMIVNLWGGHQDCLLYTSPSPRDRQKSRMPSSA